MSQTHAEATLNTQPTAHAGNAFHRKRAGEKQSLNDRVVLSIQEHRHEPNACPGPCASNTEYTTYDGLLPACWKRSCAKHLLQKGYCALGFSIRVWKG